MLESIASANRFRTAMRIQTRLTDLADKVDPNGSAESIGRDCEQVGELMADAIAINMFDDVPILQKLHAEYQPSRDYRNLFWQIVRQWLQLAFPSMLDRSMMLRNGGQFIAACHLLADIIDERAAGIQSEKAQPVHGKPPMADVSSPMNATIISHSLRANRDEANIKAREFLKTHTRATIRQVADGIGCSTGLVSNLTAWKAVNEERKKGRQPKRSSVLSLTSKMEQMIGNEDDSLARLIEEQERDTEPSPLEDDPPTNTEGMPRKAKVYSSHNSPRR